MKLLLDQFSPCSATRYPRVPDEAMADQFSVAVGAIWTAGVALQAITALLNDVLAIRNAPALITSLEQQIVDV